MTANKQRRYSSFDEASALASLLDKAKAYPTANDEFALSVSVPQNPSPLAFKLLAAAIKNRHHDISVQYSPAHRELSVIYSDAPDEPYRIRQAVDSLRSNLMTALQTQDDGSALLHNRVDLGALEIDMYIDAIFEEYSPSRNPMASTYRPIAGKPMLVDHNPATVDYDVNFRIPHGKHWRPASGNEVQTFYAQYEHAHDEPYPCPEKLIDSVWLNPAAVNLFKESLGEGRGAKRAS